LEIPGPALLFTHKNIAQKNNLYIPIGAQFFYEFIDVNSHTIYKRGITQKSAKQYAQIQSTGGRFSEIKE